ncbi:MAG: hypothetical protein HN354_11075 [Deltaproteobacteria bacterium]|jgi:hypothetical protein|nr:hypothetical protein [Deltaproteobacteria bacterium]
MQVIRKTLKTESGKVWIDVPDTFGEEVEVIILPVKDRDTDFSYQMMRYQEETGFAKKILSNEKEDIWNDI